MNKTINLHQQLTAFGIPVLIIVSMIFISKSSIFDLNPSDLSFGITFDLLLTTPLVYYLLLRKTNIPKITVFYLLILCIVISTFILPAEYHYHLIFFKAWILPIIELGVLTYVIFKVREAIRENKKQKELNFDFFTTIKTICTKVIPKKLVIPFSTEIAVFYYGFIYWKKRIPNENEYTYHKDNGTIALLFTFIFLIIIEAFVIHVLLIHLQWSNKVAWIVTCFSIYSAFQILGFLKSMTKRFISIENNKLNLRYGILSESIIDLKEIDSVEITSKDIEFNKETRKLSPLGELESHNIIIRLNKENTLNGFYGMKRKFKTLALYVDNKEEFKNKIEILCVNNLSSE